MSERIFHLHDSICCGFFAIMRKPFSSFFKQKKARSVFPSLHQRPLFNTTISEQDPQANLIVQNVHVPSFTQRTMLLRLTFASCVTLRNVFHIHKNVTFKLIGSKHLITVTCSFLSLSFLLLFLSLFFFNFISNLFLLVLNHPLLNPLHSNSLYSLYFLRTTTISQISI